MTGGVSLMIIHPKNCLSMGAQCWPLYQRCNTVLNHQLGIIAIVSFGMHQIGNLHCITTALISLLYNSNAVTQSHLNFIVIPWCTLLVAYSISQHLSNTDTLMWMDTSTIMCRKALSMLPQKS